MNIVDLLKSHARNHASNINREEIFLLLEAAKEIELLRKEISLTYIEDKEKKKKD